MTLVVSFGQHRADVKPARFGATLEQLHAWLRDDPRFAPRLGEKDGPYLSFADYGEGGTRDYDHLLASYGVPLDLDLGNYAWRADDIRARLEGFEFVAWTSYSHTAELPRWRVVVALARGANKFEHYASWEALCDRFLRDAGVGSKDATRLNYLPGPCAHPELAQLIYSAGAPWPVSEPLAADLVGRSDEWTDSPVEGYEGPEDDDALIERMLSVRLTAKDAFAPPGTPTKFQALWTGDPDALAVLFPPVEDGQAFEHTRADASLANELIYFTGGNCERSLALFERSALAQRDSYREDKGRRAIEHATKGRTQYAFVRKSVAPAVHTPGPPVPSGTVADDAPAIVAALHQCTDQRNAQRLYNAFGAQMLSAAGEFFTWAGTHWQGGARLAIRNGCHLSAIVAEEIKPLQARADILKGMELKDPSLIYEWEMLDALIPALAAWGAKCEQSATINAALAMLKNLLDVPMTTFDVDPWLLNCRNGTVDLRTGELRAHDPRDRITRCVPIDYDPTAKCERFVQFMHEVFPDAPTVDYLQRYFGYSITGSNREQTMLVHWGEGSNGKNTLHKVIRQVIGPYGQVGPPGLLTSDKSSGFIHELADLYGARWVSVDESDDGARMKEAAMKQMTGDDNVRGRHLYKSFFEYRPTYKLHLMTNHKPRVANTDHGVWRRLVLVPYTQTFDGDRVDIMLDAKLAAEAPGILAWLIEGARLYMAGGKLRPSQFVLAASAEYRKGEDMLALFVDEKCQLGTGLTVPTAQLYGAYTAWANDNGAFRLSKKRLSTDLQGRTWGISVARVGVKNEYQFSGIKLS